jgi:hypothetical protein
MDWARYKALCDSPEVLSRWMIEQTLELLGDADAAAALRAVLGGAPLEKPSDHRGGMATDMFVLALSLGQVRAISEAVQGAVASGQTTSGTRTRGLGGFVEAWDEYQRHLARRPDVEVPCSPRS